MHPNATPTLLPYYFTTNLFTKFFRANKAKVAKFPIPTKLSIINIKYIMNDQKTPPCFSSKRKEKHHHVSNHSLTSNTTITQPNVFFNMNKKIKNPLFYGI